MNEASRASMYGNSSHTSKKQTDQRDYNYFDFCMLSSVFYIGIGETETETDGEGELGTHQLCAFQNGYNPSLVHSDNTPKMRTYIERDNVYERKLSTEQRHQLLKIIYILHTYIHKHCIAYEAQSA